MGHKGLHDVNAPADLYSWIQLGLVPLLFTPWACEGPLSCGKVTQYSHLLRDCGCPVARPYSFERAWRLRCAEIHVLAARADSRCRLAR